MGQMCSTVSVMMVDRMTVTTSVSPNRPSVDPISRLPCPLAAALATPCVIIAKISGTSVICNARTHNCPSGNVAVAAATSHGGPAQRNAMPPSVPSTSASRIKRVRFMPRSLA